MTLLDAINRVLGSIGETPLASLQDVDNFFEAGIARDIINETYNEVMLEGWLSVQGVTEFDQLPHPFKMFITVRASKKFHQQVIGEDSKDGTYSTLKLSEVEAWDRMLQYDLSQTDKPLSSLVLSIMDEIKGEGFNIPNTLTIIDDLPTSLKGYVQYKYVRRMFNLRPLKNPNDEQDLTIHFLPPSFDETTAFLSAVRGDFEVAEQSLTEGSVVDVAYRGLALVGFNVDGTSPLTALPNYLKQYLRVTSQLKLVTKLVKDGKAQVTLYTEAELDDILNRVILSDVSTLTPLGVLHEGSILSKTYNHLVDLGFNIPPSSTAITDSLSVLAVVKAVSAVKLGELLGVQQPLYSQAEIADYYSAAIKSSCDLSSELQPTSVLSQTYEDVKAFRWSVDKDSSGEYVVIPYPLRRYVEIKAALSLASKINTAEGVAVTPYTDVDAVEATTKAIEDELNRALTNPDIYDSYTYRKKREILAEGYTFNTDEMWVFVPDETGYITLPDNVLAIDVYDRFYKVERRGKYLYDVERNSFIFTSPATCTVVWDIPLIDLPTIAKHYVRVKVGRDMALELLGREIGGYTMNDVLEASNALFHYESEQLDASIFDNYSVSKIVNRAVNPIRTGGY